uniref:Otoraplin n=1 Tax=Amphiprion percula TaxID=161767 RepID=A0A3P8SR64_AMPPE
MHLKSYFISKSYNKIHMLDSVFEDSCISLFCFVFCALSDVLSMATALDDFIAPDCRFINIRKGQMVYVYSKLVPAEGTGVFWSGSVYSERYVDQMGIIGYFPATVVKETHKFAVETVKMQTTDMDFYCD